MTRIIGIVGGIGSYAGIDLVRKIYDLTDARSDQDHLPVYMLSIPHMVQDRTRFLLNEVMENPAESIGMIINTLVAGGAEIIGIPCNTAHVSSIYDRIIQLAPDNCKVLHMIKEVGEYLSSNHPQVSTVGVLATTGTYMSKVYSQVLGTYGLEVIYPSEDIQHLFVHRAIYDLDYGIKAHSNPVNPLATDDLMFAARYLIRQGADALILGCTEIPLALTMAHIESIPLIDSTLILAKALIGHAVATKTFTYREA